MKKEKMLQEPIADKNEIVVYQPEGAEFHIAVRVENETVWLTQAQMAELFATDRTSINKHIRNIFQTHELDETSTCAKNAQVRIEGNRAIKRTLPYYNLDMIISVGYRVNSISGTRFRQWANQVLKEYMLKGYAVNQRMFASQAQQKLIENVDTRLTAVEHRVDFFVNTVHSAQNQKIEQLSNDVQKVMENFIDPTTFKHFLILDGQRLEADVAYMKIYGMAKKNIIIIDNYLGVKTLDLLREVAKGMTIKIISNAMGCAALTPDIINDFSNVRPDINFTIQQTNRKFHDRYIFLDYGLQGEKLFHCEASA